MALPLPPPILSRSSPADATRLHGAVALPKAPDHRRRDDGPKAAIKAKQDHQVDLSLQKRHRPARGRHQGAACPLTRKIPTAIVSAVTAAQIWRVGIISEPKQAVGPGCCKIHIGALKSPAPACATGRVPKIAK